MRACRRANGNAISETGPALFLFFIIIFFPMLDVLGMACQYGAGWYLNHMMTRELACSKQSDEAQVKTNVNNDFMQTGMASFCKITALNHAVAWNVSANPKTVRCTTSFMAAPFITVPWFTGVPGLNEPVQMRFSNERPREDTR